MNQQLPHTDKHLLQQIADGNHAAFKQLFSQYTPLLLPYITRFVNSANIAEEIVQEVFIRIWMHRDKLTEVEHPQAWIFRVAANNCYNYLRKKELDNKIQKQFTPKQSEDPLDLSSYHQLQQAIDEAVRQLPGKRRQIYLMSRVEGLKPSEIAEKLGLSVSTVKNTLSTALESIRQHLIKKGLFIWACWVLMKNF